MEIVKTREGYQLVNERLEVLQTDVAENFITAAIEESRTELDLKENGCYKDLELTAQMQDTLRLW